MSLHFKTVRVLYGGVPIPVAFGPSETGKSTAIRKALSLLGCGMYVKGTNAVFLTRAAACGLPFAIDDPKERACKVKAIKPTRY